MHYRTLTYTSPGANCCTWAFRRILAAALVAGFASVAGGEPASNPPDESSDHLRRLVQAREWRKARVEYRRTTPDSPDGRYYSETVSGSDILSSDYGDEEGAISRDRHGNPGPLGTGPVHYLRLEDQVWIFGQGQIYADLWIGSEGHSAFDPRTLGLTPWRHNAGLEAEFGLSGTRQVRYHRLLSDGLETVRAEFGDGWATEWRLDPQQGGLPIAVTHEMEGRIVAECRSELREFDGLWYPSRVTYYGEGGKAGGRVQETIEVLSLELEPADVPDRLTPEYIGIDAGMNIQLRRGSKPGAELRKWDGKNALTLEEYVEAARAGRLRAGPVFLANLERAKALEEQRAADLQNAAARATTSRPAASAPAPTLLETLTGWEAYTRRFIERHRLDAEQSQRAMSVLMECQDLGRAHLAHVAGELDEWRRLTGRPSPTTRTTDNADDRLNRLHARIFGRLNEITNVQLRPRLDAIPTRAQRNAAGAP